MQTPGHPRRVRRIDESHPDLPAIAHAAGLRRPTSQDWARVSRQVPRLVDALPNGPRHFATVQVFLAGGVPEVMLHLRRMGALDTRVLTAEGITLDAQLDAWESSERRATLRRRLREQDGVDADDVIMSPETAVARGLTPTVCFPHGNSRRRIRDQEHGDRSIRADAGGVLLADGSGESVSHRDLRDRSHQAIESRRAMFSC